MEERKIREEEGFEKFKNMISDFITDSLLIDSGDENAEIIEDAQYYDKNIKTLFNDMKEILK